MLWCLRDIAVGGYGSDDVAGLTGDEGVNGVGGSKDDASFGAVCLWLLVIILRGFGKASLGGDGGRGGSVSLVPR